jgi:hypothetical protein
MIFRRSVRLSDPDLKVIHDAFRAFFLEKDHLWLFGSRANTRLKGGDIDLYIETHAKTAKQAIDMKHKFLIQIENNMGEQKIDLVLNLLNFPVDLPIYTVAKSEGVKLI